MSFKVDLKVMKRPTLGIEADIDISAWEMRIGGSSKTLCSKLMMGQDAQLKKGTCLTEHERNISGSWLR